MIIARQEQPSWVSERISYFSSKYSPAQASQTASSDNEGQQFSDKDNDNDATSAFVTATNLSFGIVTATLESATAATTSVTDIDAQSLSSSEASSTESTAQATSKQWTSSTMTTSIAWTQPKSRPGWHSYAPSSSNTASSVETEPASLSSGLQPQQKAHHSPNTPLIAGVVVPIVVLLASGLAFLTCLRRRRRRAALTTTVVANDTATSDADGAPTMMEKVSEKKVDSNIPPPTLMTTMLSPIDEAMATPRYPQLVITSPQNPTYFTGLDTFSVHSAATSEDAPPPYRARSVLSHTSSERRQPSIVTNYAPRAPVSPASPVSPIAHIASPFSDVNAINIARSPSQRSFASTLYSSNASVYEARPARRSIGPAEYVISRMSSTEDNIRVRSPFEDPEDESDNVRREHL